MTKTCQQCGEEFHQGARGDKQFAARRYCGRACYGLSKRNSTDETKAEARAVRGQRNRGIHEGRKAMAKAKVCESCSEAMTMSQGDNISKFVKRRFCSIQCCGEAKLLPAEARTCQACEAVLVRRNGERSSSFTKRTHCDEHAHGSRERGRSGRCTAYTG